MAVAVSGNDFNERPVLRSYKVITGVLIRDLEIEVRYIPVGKALWIRRGDREMLDAFEHIADFTTSSSVNTP